MGKKILIADNHKVVREAVGYLLSNELGMELVGEADDGRTAVQIARELLPDIVIMDIGMPKLNGIEATRQIVHELPDIRVIVLSERSDKHSVLEMFKAGASGYVPKQCTFKELALALQNVISNRIYLSPQISKVVIEGFLHRSTESDNSVYSVLTPREREVLQLITEGRPTKAIAKELYVSCKTIEWHRSQLMKKLGVQNIAELVKYAIREGLTCAYA
jgi:DNA-binding NarL/FixJ family response regulator